MAEAGQEHDHDQDQDQSPDQDAGQADTAVDDLPPLKVDAKDTGPARKSLTVEIPAERIEAKVGDGFDRLRTDTVVPGFRRGRAPKRLIEKRFGSAIRDDARNELISDSYTEAIEQLKVDVVGEPKFQDLDDLKLPESGPMTFEVEIEVFPEFDLPSLEGIEVDKPVFEVSDQEVDDEIAGLGKRHGQLETLDEGKIDEEDYVGCAIRVLPGHEPGDDAEPIAEQPDGVVLVPSKQHDYKGHVLGIIVDDLGKQLKGQKVGEQLDLKVTGPSGHEDEKIKDQPITIELKLHNIQRVKAATTDDVVQAMGMDNEEALRGEVRQSLEQVAERRQHASMHESVQTKLLDLVKMELPKGLSDRQTVRYLHREALDLAYQGMSEEDVERTIAERRSGSEEKAQADLKLFFILDKAARELDVEVSEGEINNRIFMLAYQQGRRPEKIRQQMQRSGQLEQLYLQLRDQKTLDKIIEKATVTEVDAPADETAETKGKKKTKKSSSKKKADDSGDDAKAEAKADEPAKKKTSGKKKSKAKTDEDSDGS